MDIYKQFSMQVTPVIVLNFHVDDEFYDINVSPDKREVFLKNEQEIIKELKIKLSEFFDNIQKSKVVQSLKKKKGDGYNPTLGDEENLIVMSLQKKKVLNKDDEEAKEEEIFKNRKESGVQKSMSQYNHKFSQYKDNLKKKRTSKEQETESKDISNKYSDSQNSCKDNSEDIPRVKRLKTDFELEQKLESEDKLRLIHSEILYVEE